MRININVAQQENGFSLMKNKKTQTKAKDPFQMILDRMFQQIKNQKNNNNIDKKDIQMEKSIEKLIDRLLHMLSEKTNKNKTKELFTQLESLYQEGKFKQSDIKKILILFEKNRGELTHKTPISEEKELKKVDLAKEFMTLVQNILASKEISKDEKRSLPPTLKDTITEHVTIHRKLGQTKENVAEKVKSERVIHDLRTVLKTVKQESFKEMIDTKLEVKQEAKQETRVFFHEQQIKTESGMKMFSVEQMKVELPKEIRRLADFQVFTPNRIAITLDQMLGGGEIRLERANGNIMIEVRTNDIRVREQMEVLLHEIKDEMNTKGIELKFEMKDEERKEEKEKEERYLEKKRENRDQEKQEGKEDEHKRN